MTHHPVLRSAAAVTAALTGLTIGGLAFMGGAQAAGNGNGDTARHTISPAAAWASHVPGHALAAKSTVHAKVWLAPRGGQSQLEAFAKAVSDPGSASYGHYLSAAAYRSRFAPTKADVDAVTTWLTSAGLHVEGTGPDNHFLAVAGSPAAIDAAFTAGIKGFTVNGQSVTGATHAVSAPASVATHVLAVTGLSTLGHQVTPSTASTEPDAPGTNKGHRVQLGPPAGFVNAPPCSAYYGQKLATGQPKFDGKTLPYAVCGYTPSQLRGA
jgi:subtilase family serine protease